MKNRLWSTYVQTSEELYLSRSIRFRKDNAHIWLPAIKAKDNTKILEIGCAGGLLCHRIKALLPNCEVTGLDRDEGHIEYAINKSKEVGIKCDFVVGDALALPYNDNKFDYVISHTVMEHVEPKKFLSEQIRILKPGGRIAMLSVRAGHNISVGEKQISDREKELFDKAWTKPESTEERIEVCAYNFTEQEIVREFERAGFQSIEVAFIALNWYSPDNADTDYETGKIQIECKRLHALENIKKALRLNANALSEAEQNEIRGIINQKYDERLGQLKANEKIWDFTVSGVMAVTAVK